MINVGILGGDNSLAGELLRILVNHPDVVIRGICEPSLAEHDVTSVHHGLMGETSLKFCAELDYGKLDVLFVTLPCGESRAVVPPVGIAPELCVIDVNADFSEARAQDPLVVYGVPEINRKPLVRGARRVVIPSPAEVVASIALMPLAVRSMLDGIVDVVVDTGRETQLRDSNDVAKYVGQALRLVSGDSDFDIHISVNSINTDRCIELNTVIKSPIPIDNIIDIYEELYDDHNLTYVTAENMDIKEVVGTDKCIVSLTMNSGGDLRIRAIADSCLRGGAGDAVHVMNLLMGLYEKTGLSLKASMY